MEDTVNEIYRNLFASWFPADEVIDTYAKAGRIVIMSPVSARHTYGYKVAKAYLAGDTYIKISELDTAEGFE